ncbi:MAG: hypothetical protein KDH88_20375 [Chromatiales bacterium]|nr:hypothetical protein [Chromatiales bacterium]
MLRPRTPAKVWKPTETRLFAADCCFLGHPGSARQGLQVHRIRERDRQGILRISPQSPSRRV